MERAQTTGEEVAVRRSCRFSNMIPLHDSYDPRENTSRSVEFDTKSLQPQEPTREERERNPGEGRERKGQLELSFSSSLPSLSRQTHVKASRSMTRQQNTSPTTALEEGAILCEKKANEEVGRRKTLGGERRGRASRKARAGEAGLFWSLGIGKLFLDLSDQIKA